MRLRLGAAAFGLVLVRLAAMPAFGATGNPLLDRLFEAPPPPSPQPQANVSLNPPSAAIPSNAPIGALLSQISVTMSDGSDFAGSLGFGEPYGSGGGCCGIANKTIILACDLEVVFPTGSGSFTCTIEAYPFHR